MATHPADCRRSASSFAADADPLHMTRTLNGASLAAFAGQALAPAAARNACPQSIDSFCPAWRSALGRGGAVHYGLLAADTAKSALPAARYRRPRLAWQSRRDAGPMPVRRPAAPRIWLRANEMCINEPRRKRRRPCQVSTCNSQFRDFARNRLEGLHQDGSVARHVGFRRTRGGSPAGRACWHRFEPERNV